ncbi:MAG: 4-hydroxy-tetrahydrodipicolinate reductase [Candidatus Cloacimonadales bacterium]|jgi:4-hydroxy-tetrahydrodipicolinate reductase|nr:4-hydroxy-tetrahydrodipicolinate reductase [Candidatus Cloacimonadales bacterium]
MTNLALVGYGKMGHMIYEQAKEKGYSVEAIVDPNTNNFLKSLEDLRNKNIDVCIDFSRPDAAFDNIKKYAQIGINAVVGTTGWYDKMSEVENLVAEANIGMIFGANFSVGMNIYYQILEQCIGLFNKLPEYDIYGYESHHRQKAVSPSGTAKEICSLVLDKSVKKESIVYDKLDRAPKHSELHFASIRGGSIPGTHVLGFDSFADSIEIKHTARNREGFASGALLAANWIKGKKGFYNFKSIFGEIINA